jgi:hypothetical protein
VREWTIIGRGANLRIRLDSLPPIRMVGDLFTGNVTVVRQHARRSCYRIDREKLTIRSENHCGSDSYNIAQNLIKMLKGCGPL